MARGSSVPRRMVRRWFGVRTASLAGALALLSIFAGTTAPQESYRTLGPASCGLGQANCHAQQNTWWQNDDHHATVDGLLADANKSRQIAEKSGVGAASILKGTGGCMDCHGTVISGKETRSVDDGVSCENCHGPGSAYLEPHSLGDVSAGINRVGYKRGLELGMAELKNINTRANACVGCHFINDPALIRAGHPDGRGFLYERKIKEVAGHWRREPSAADLNRAPFAAAFQRKDTIFIEPVVSTSTDFSPGSARVDTIYIAVGGGTQVERPRQFVLDSFPTVTDSLSIDSVLTILKRRLDYLYDQYRDER